MRNFNETFRKDVSYDNIKSHKETELYSPFRKYSFGKTTWGSNLPSNISKLIVSFEKKNVKFRTENASFGIFEI